MKDQSIKKANVEKNSGISKLNIEKNLNIGEINVKKDLVNSKINKACTNKANKEEIEKQMRKK